MPEYLCTLVVKSTDKKEAARTIMRILTADEINELGNEGRAWMDEWERNRKD